jgi:hypothetical protein
MLAMGRSARPSVLILLLITNALNVIAQALLLRSGLTGAGHGLLLPAAYAASGLAPVVGAVWLWVLVRRPPGRAAALLRPGFVALGWLLWAIVAAPGGQLAAAGQPGAAAQEPGPAA